MLRPPIVTATCKKCGYAIYQRQDGVWDLEYVEWRPTEFCIVRDADGNPEGFDTSGHEPDHPVEREPAPAGPAA